MLPGPATGGVCRRSPLSHAAGLLDGHRGGSFEAMWRGLATCSQDQRAVAEHVTSLDAQDGDAASDQKLTRAEGAQGVTLRP